LINVSSVGHLHFSSEIATDRTNRRLATKPWVRRLALCAAFRDPRVMSAELAAKTKPLFGGPGFVDAVAAAGRAVRATVPEAITCPVLLMWGERDVIAPPRCAKQMPDRLPDSELVVFAGAGHTPMIEFPEQFNDLALRFIAARSGDYSGVRRRTENGLPVPGA
jgi:pimeloyl-ACP methyl ester carboxylesterase